MGIFDRLKQPEKKTVTELQEENEEAELELSIAQKRAAQAKLTAAGLDRNKDFGGSWRSVIQWLKTH